MSDEQRRRQDTCRWLLNPADSFEFPRQPNLLFWCRPLAAGVSLPDGFDVAGSALAMMPLDLRRTPAKSPFQIPATFLRVDVAKSKHGASIAYQRKTGEWVKGLTVPTETALRFQLPEQVLPCRLQRGMFTIRINAPSRELTVRAYQGDEPLLVRSVRNPNGVIDFELHAEQLSQDALGGVMIGVSVGETDLQKSKRLHDEQRLKSPPTSFKDLSPEPEFFENSTWQIDYVRLTVSGQTN